MRRLGVGAQARSIRQGLAEKASRAALVCCAGQPDCATTIVDFSFLADINTFTSTTHICILAAAIVITFSDFWSIARHQRQ